MSVVFSYDDVWIKVWESLQPEEKSKVATSDWAFVQNVTVSEQQNTSNNKQIGNTHDRNEVLGASAHLKVSSYDDGTMVDIANNSAMKYLVEVEYYDEEANETKAYTLYECTPVSRNLGTGDINTLDREWEIGRIA